MNMLRHNEMLVSETNRKYTVVRVLEATSSGEIYEVENGGRLFGLKLFYKSISNTKMRNHIRFLIEKGAPSDAFAWPVDMVAYYDQFGYIFSRLIPSNYKTWIDILKHKTSPSLETLCIVAENMCKQMQEYHSHGYALPAEFFYFFDPETGSIFISLLEHVYIPNDSVYMIGNPKLSAPEIVRGASSPSRNSDRFVLALYLFYLLMGNHPLDTVI